MTQTTHYPSFNVINEMDAWDDHTQSIVKSRLSEKAQYQFLSEQEAHLLTVLCSLLMSDPTPEVMGFVIHHIDQTLHASPGESQRKVGVPAGKDLIRQGLQALDKTAYSNNSVSFIALPSSAQQQLIHEISMGTAQPGSDWSRVPQKPFFLKLMSLTIESYCSHPIVWTEIGYAGPAYPRGYVRTQLGQLDPWEAKAEHE